MALDLAWRLGRLRALVSATRQHLRREGWRRTLAKATRRAGEISHAAVVARNEASAADTDPAPRILILDAQMPDPTRDSGSVRLCRMLGILQAMGWRVFFVTDNLHAQAIDQARLEALGVQVLCRPQVSSLAHWLRRMGPTLDAVMLCRHPIAQAHWALVRRHAPSARLVFDTVDLHYLRQQRALDQAGRPDPARQRQVDRTRRQELALIDQCDATLVVSPAEAALLRQQLPAANIQVLSNIHDACPDTPGHAARQGLLFVGGWGHPPNRDAIDWLVHDIMPHLRQALPGVQLHLVGDMPDTARAALAAADIHIHGRVPELAPLLDTTRLALAPLRYGAGVKGKINSAMSRGLPVVATSMAIEGMYLRADHDVLVGDNASEFAAQVARAYTDAALWQSLSDHALQNIRAHFSPQAAQRCLHAVLGPHTANAAGKSCPATGAGQHKPLH